MKLETYMAEHGIKNYVLAEHIKRTRQTVTNLIADKCIVIDGIIYKPIYNNLTQLAESKNK